MSGGRRGWILGLGIGVGLVGVLWIGSGVLFDAFKVPTASMEPAVDPGDRILVQTVRFDVGRGDKVIYEVADDPRVSTRLSRVVGLAGERIEAREGTVRVDGHVIDEGYLAHDSVTDDFRPVTVPADHVFVISDNRGNARDSRMIGSIPRDQIVGTVAFVGVPIDRILLGATAALGVALLLTALTTRRTRGPT